MHWLEHHWYNITRLQWILVPISMVFRALVAIRRAMYRDGALTSHRLLQPVIVAGNINADAKAPHQSVINVMEAARLAGYGHITFTTQNAPR